MKTRLFAFVVTAILLTTSLSAQSFLGFRSGLSLGNYQNDYALEDGLESHWNKGLAVSLFAELPLADRFSLQPELGYLEKGVMFSNENDNSYEQTWRYLEIPLLARYRFFSGNDRFYLTAGPALGLAFEGKRKYDNWPMNADGEGDIVRVSSEQDYNFRSDYIEGRKDRRWDLGLVVGTGASFGLGSGKLLLDARYGLDLTDNVAFESEAPAGYEGTYHRNFVFSVGYAFPIGG